MLDPARQVRTDRPALVVVFELEETRPRLLFAVRDRRDYERLLDWIETQPDLAALVRDALDASRRDPTPSEEA